MDIRRLTDHYAVSPQIAVEDVPAISAAGFGCVICNRPDAEVPPDLQAEALRAAVEGAGLQFHVLPITHQTMTEDRVAEQARIVAGSESPVLAYCASGTRCTIIWALGAADIMDEREIISRAASAGYDISGLAGRLSR